MKLMQGWALYHASYWRYNLLIPDNNHGGIVGTSPQHRPDRVLALMDLR